MANTYRGEIDGEFDGQAYALCLTLGGLAEMEAAFQQTDLAGLAERFGKGRLSAGEIITVLHLGLKGAGHALTREQVANMHVKGGAAGAVHLVMQLLTQTFGLDEPEQDKGEAPRP